MAAHTGHAADGADGAPARHPTLADVASAAGVSASTASRALRASPLVRDDTRRRVLAAADALGFEANRLARSLRTQSSLSVGIVVPDVATAFWAAAVKGAQDVLEQAGYLVLVMSSERDPARERAALRRLRAYRVDGILLATSGDYDPLAAGTPVVFFDRFVPGDDSGHVALANREGMTLLVDHLRDHGHTRIGFVGGHPGSTSADERRAAFEAAAGALGARRPGYVRAGDEGWTEASAEEAAHAMLSLAGRPTAIVAASDTLAVGTLRAIRKLGLRVPGDVALVSFDDPIAGDLIDPPLTALTRHDRESGELAAGLLLRALAGDHERPEVRIPLRLIPRRSCGCDPGG